MNNFVTMTICQVTSYSYRKTNNGGGAGTVGIVISVRISNVT